MGWDIVPIAKHNLNVSNIETLAKDLANRLEVNIEYGFYALKEHLNLFELPFIDGFNLLGSFIKNKNYITFILTDENYTEKLLLEKYGIAIFYDLRYWDRPYNEGNLPDKTYIKEIIDNLQYNWYNFEYDNDDEYQFITIYNECYSNSIPYYRRWSGLCQFFEDKVYLKEKKNNSFINFRKQIMDFTLKLGSNKVYYINDQNPLLKGIGQSVEAQMTWVAVENFIIEKTKHLMIDVPKFYVDKNYRDKFHQKQKYPLSFVDDFRDL